MTANIASDGARDLFASHREVAWHGLGTVFQQEVTDYTEMLRLSGLGGWDIHEMPVSVTDHDGSALDARFVVPAKAIVATVNGENRVLGLTGERYEIVQNEEAFSFLQSLSDGASWETAGAIRDGRVVFGSIALDREIVLDPSGAADAISAYLLVTTSHDGSGSVTGGRTPVRVVCENTLNIALPGISQSFKFRHTMTVAERMAKGAEEWRKNNVYFDRFEAEAKELFETPATDRQFFGIVENLFPRPEKDVKGALTKWERRQETFAQAWNGAPNAGIKNTAWGVLNALTEANQWGRNVRKGGRGAENFAAAGAGFDIPTNQFRATALAAAKALV